MNLKRTIVVVATATSLVGVALVATLFTAGANAAPGQPCDALPQGSEHVALDPSNFVARVDNPLWPMAPGTVWVYRETNDAGDLQRNVVTVERRTKTIEGIDATVVRDVIFERGQLTEHTFDWYAQDTCGNVWYLGENTEELHNGNVTSREGSWQAGVHGAEAGVIVPADPQPLQDYRQEYLAGHAEDNARTLSVDEQVGVPFGHFRDAMLVRESSPLEPAVLEYKLYAPGVGPAMAVSVSGETDREVLLKMTTP